MMLSADKITRMLSPSEEKGLLYFASHEDAKHNVVQMATAQRLAAFARHSLLEIIDAETVRLTPLGRDVVSALQPKPAGE